MRKKVELLAPAGDTQCLKAAIHAGADAVYIGGIRFGARAYANNFNDRELCEAIDYVHFFGKKVYLTLNTLLKDEEIKDVPDYVKPFYETGLDGVIVQDFGVVNVLREHFPDMEIHASTQMTVTGPYAALELKKMGISRVVPARELSLDEIQKIEENADVEVETFIHGAMCYSYSGQCLFSSFLGGRSGNRGRCAGPCRLPYDLVNEKGKKVNCDKERYPLSLKDLGTIEILPELMEAGISSFKIEGRMKSPEYVAGVTSIYRKYIDLYLNDKTNFKIDKKDLTNLKNLYTRGSMETGYYKRHNGRDMVTLSKGSYENSVSGYTEEIKKCYIDNEKKLAIAGKAVFKIDKPGTLEVYVTRDDDSGNEIKFKTSTIINVMAAQKRPMEEEDIRRQLSKTGNSDFVFEKLEIEKDEGIFIPNKELNELRRNVLEQLKIKILEEYRRNYKLPSKKKQNCTEEKTLGGRLTVSITTKEQLKALLESEARKVVKRIYFPYSLFFQMLKEKRELQQCRELGILCYVSFPAIVREKELIDVQATLKSDVECKIFDVADGFLVNNLEIFAFLKEYVKGKTKTLDFQSDYGLYSFNKNACLFLKEIGVKYMTAPFEWSKHEIKRFAEELPGQNLEVVVYGYLPLMETANCIYKTLNQCKKEKGDQKFLLKDRYNTCFPVITDCVNCKNTILNSVPLSLYKEWSAISKYQNLDYRLRFTIEDFETTKQVIRQFGMLVSGKNVDSIGDKNAFTTGHFRKGIL